MAGPGPQHARLVFEALRPVHPRPACPCLHLQPLRRRSPRLSRHVSTVTAQLSEMEVDGQAPPRWSHTPPAMKAPVRSRPKPEGVTSFTVNTSPQKLDEVYLRFLGRGGDKMLSEETKWLAVTHKSFDHGRRGFNDRLAFLGKRIVELQTSLVLLSTSDSARYLQGGEDPHGREPYRHPAIDAVECLSGNARSWFTHHKQISHLSSQYGIPEVMRWQPKNPDSLLASGADMVYAQAVFAIVGALALEQGGAVANRVAKERILLPLRKTGRMRSDAGPARLETEPSARA